MSTLSLPNLTCNGILCRYSEIGTKGKNRKQFELQLIQRLRTLLEPMGKLRVFRDRGRIFIRHEVTSQPLSSTEYQLLKDVTPRIAGLVSTSPGLYVKPTLEAIEDAIEKTFDYVYQLYDAEFANDEPIQYCMRARRSNRDFAMSTNELEIHFANKLLVKYPRLKINLKKPQLRIDVEVRDQLAFISYERIKGPGGLPSGSGGRMLALLSGGIDSPVACYELIKRGAHMNYITFHSEPYTTAELIRTVAELSDIINMYQIPGILMAGNLLPAQKEIRDKCNERYRTILYRRMMMRISSVLADYNGDKALVTGENIGQVASQTMENMSVIAESTQKLILRPVLANDKVDIIAKAEKIGTFDLSKKSVPDSCTVFAPSRPATTSTLERIKEEEAKIDVLALVRECLEQTSFIDLETFEKKPMTWLLKRYDDEFQDGQF